MFLGAAAGIHDHTVTLAATGGRGLVEHYGYHALLLSSPVLIWLVVRIASQLGSILASPHFVDGALASSSSIAFQAELLDFATRRSPRLRGLFGLFCLVGALAVASNAASTRHPEIVYGQDVFDAWQHPWGYVAGRLFLSYYWVYLLPVVGYVALVATYCTFRIVRRFTEQKDYTVASFAADGCGGFRPLGSLMMTLVYLYVPIAAVIAALTHTHAKVYATLLVATGLMIALVVGHLFLPFVHLHRLLARLKLEKLQRLEKSLNEAETAVRAKPNDPGEDSDITPYLALLAGDSLYRQTQAMPTWPYLPADRFKWLTPLIPIAASAILKILASRP